MNEWKEFSAKTVDEATKDAINYFKVSEDKIEIEVVEKESKGLLGMFSKNALIKARVKEEAVEKTVVEEAKEEVKEEAKEEVTQTVKENEDVITSETSKKDDSNKKELTQEESISLVKNFLEKVFVAMEIKADMEIKYDSDEDIIEVNLEGDDMGVLIGKRGQTLDSLQYLSSLVVNKESKSYIKVKIDTENYRQRRKETLENLAKNIAKKVTRTRKTCTLEPMNPYDRRIIHSALQNDKFVETHSEGEEPNRRVVVSLKSGVMPYNKKKNNYRNNKYSNRYDSAKEYKKKFNENYKKSYQSITFDDIKKEDANNE